MHKCVERQLVKVRRPPTRLRLVAELLRSERSVKCKRPSTASRGRAIRKAIAMRRGTLLAP